MRALRPSPYRPKQCPTSPLLVWEGRDDSPIWRFFESDGDRLEQWADSASDSMLHRWVGWTATQVAAPSTASDISEDLLGGLDSHRLAEMLSRHPAWTTLAPAEPCDPMLFIPRSVFLEYVLFRLSRWWSISAPPGADEFADTALRLLLPNRFSCSRYDHRIVFLTLEDTGLAEFDGSSWSLERPRVFGALCCRLGVQGGVTLHRETYPQCRASLRTRVDRGQHPLSFWHGLGERDATVLRSRWLERLTLDQTADRISLTKERIRQIQVKAENTLPGLVNQHMAGCFVDVLGAQPSGRLLVPEDLRSSLVPVLGFDLSCEQLARFLSDRFDLAPHPLCGGALWWLPIEEGEPPSDTVRWMWTDEGGRSPHLETSPNFLTTWERQTLFDNAVRFAEEQEATPSTWKDFVACALRELGRPSYLQKIVETTAHLFPDKPVASQIVYHTLQRYTDTFYHTGSTGIYALKGMESLPLPEDADAPRRGRRTSVELPSALPPEELEPPLPQVLGGTEMQGVQDLSHEEMSLFAGLDPEATEEALTEAVRRLVARLAALPIPRSLCEVKTTSGDYEWLRQWLAGLKRPVLRTWLEGTYTRRQVEAGIRMSLQEMIGLVLVLFISETARRKAQEGNLWSAVVAEVPEALCGTLFVQGQPSHLLKEAFQAAARRLGLRHVFGQEGTQEYYISTFLQFGFTRPALAKLPVWLAGYQISEAVRYLTESRLESSSFKLLWRTLRDYRRKNVREDRMRAVLSESPWVPTDWVEELLRHAIDRPDLDRGAQVAQDDGPLPFLDRPRLVWTPGEEPRFECHIANLTAMDLTEARYDLTLGDDLAPTVLLRQADDSYLYDDRIPLPCTPATREAVLADDGGVILATVDCLLWDPNEDVLIFDMSSGQPKDAWVEPMSPKKAYALLLASDLTVEGEVAAWRSIGGTHRLHYLVEGWPDSLRVTLEDETLWTPNLSKARRERPAAPEWATAHFQKPEWDEVRIGETIGPWLVCVQEDVSIDFARLGNQSLEVTETPEGLQLEAFTLTPDIVASGLEIAVSLRHGNHRATIKKRLPVRPVGVIGHTVHGREAVRQDVDLHKADVRAQVFQFFLPAGMRDVRTCDLAVLEGSTFLRKLWSGTNPPPQELSGRRTMASRSLGSVYGFGAPLTVRHPYNSLGRVQTMTVAPSVIDTGLLDSAQRDEERVILCWRRPIQPGDGHSVLVWRPGEEPSGYAADTIEVLDDATWFVPATGTDDSCCVAAAYEGARLGAVWPTSLWSHQLDGGPDATCPPERTAALLRWMQVPVLHRNCRCAIMTFAERHPAEALSAWLLGSGLPETLEMPSLSEEWLAVVRALFANWKPEASEASPVTRLFRVGRPQETLLATVHNLLRVDPRLMDTVVSAWVERRRDNGGNRRNLAAELHEARWHLAALEANDNEDVFRNRLSALLGEVAMSMNVDPNFLEQGIVSRLLSARHGAPLSEIDATNLETALHVEPFRRYLGLCILREMEREV